MKIVYNFIFVCIICGVYGCREAPIRDSSQKGYYDRNKKDIDIKTRRTKKNIQISSADNIELPTYRISDNKILLSRKRYTALYNVTNKIPDWVAWQLKPEHSEGSYKRLGVYFEDNSVPSPRAKDDDYKSSIWTHGHMCPAGDNKWDSIAMRESNLLTNICPQHASLNSGLWNKIEQDCRIWAKQYGDLYIVCGPVLYNKEHETIGDNKVVVPEAFFKVILCLQGTPKAIGFIIKNNEGKKKMDQYVNTVDEVERITGIDFFPALPNEIENKVEAKADIKEW